MILNQGKSSVRPVAGAPGPGSTTSSKIPEKRRQAFASIPRQGSAGTVRNDTQEAPG